MKRAILLGFISFAATSPTLAETPQAANPTPINIINEPASSSSDFQFSYGPPSSPAVDLLGLGSTKDASSSTLSPFLLSLGPVVGGTSGAYGGIDMPLALIFSKSYAELVKAKLVEDPRWKHYVPASSTDYLWARARLDFGATTGTANSDPTKSQLSGVAIGLSMSLLSNDFPSLVSTRQIASIPANGQNAPQGANPSYFSQCLYSLGGIQDAVSEQDALNKGFVFAANGDLASTDEIGKDETDFTGLLQSNASSSTIFSVIKLYEMKKPYANTAPAAAHVSLGPHNGSEVGPDGQTLQQAVAELEGRFAAAQKANDDAANGKAQEDAAKPTAKFAKALTACSKGATILASVAPDLSVGAGYREMGTAGQLSHLGSPGGAFWLAMRTPLLRLIDAPSLSDRSNRWRTFEQADWTTGSTYDQVNAAKVIGLLAGFSGRADLDSRFLTGNTTTPVIQVNKLSAWGALQLNLPTVQLAGQYGYSDWRATDGAHAKYNQSGTTWLVQGSFKLFSTGVWIGGSYGDATGTSSKLKDRVFLLSLYTAQPPATSVLATSAPN